MTENEIIGKIKGDAVFMLGYDQGFKDARRNDRDLNEAASHIDKMASKEAELRSCLRGAITGLECLQDLIRDYGTRSFLPGLPDLIQRCKKAVDA